MDKLSRDEIVEKLCSLDREVVEDVLARIHDESELTHDDETGGEYHKMYLLLSMLITDMGQKVWDEAYGDE